MLEWEKKLNEIQFYPQFYNFSRFTHAEKEKKCKSFHLLVRSTIRREESRDLFFISVWLKNFPLVENWDFFTFAFHSTLRESENEKICFISLHSNEQFEQKTKVKGKRLRILSSAHRSQFAHISCLLTFLLGAILFNIANILNNFSFEEASSDFEYPKKYHRLVSTFELENNFAYKPSSNIPLKT